MRSLTWRSSVTSGIASYISRIVSNGGVVVCSHSARYARSTKCTRCAGCVRGSDMMPFLERHVVGATGGHHCRSAY